MALALDLISFKLVSFSFAGNSLYSGPTVRCSYNSSRTLYAGSSLGSDSSILYTVDLNNYNLYALNTTDCSMTTLAKLSFKSGTGAAVGLTWSSYHNIFYLLSTNCGQATHLYNLTISPSVTLTSIGDVNASCGVTISADSGGNLYVLDLHTDYLLSVSPKTAETTYIGPIGFNANAAQGMDFDPTTGTLWLAAVNAKTSGELRIVNVTSGNSTLIESLSSQYDAFSFSGLYYSLVPCNVFRPKSTLY